MPRVRARRAAFLAVALLSGAGAGSDVAARQSSPELRVERADGSVQPVRVAEVRGSAGVDVALFRDLGWAVSETSAGVQLSLGDRATVVLTGGSPFVRWDGRPLQLADAPAREGQQIWVPLQLVAEVLPGRLPDLYEYDAGTRTLRAASRSAAAQGQESVLRTPPRDDDLRLIWIDAGHGGADPGAIGHGLREKDIALSISRRVVRILEQDRRLEVRMTRDDDGFVDLWERGLLATDAKGERTGVFVSIHANSFPARRATRGFETYFLSEARTEDERRVSAIENAPLSIRGRGMDTNRQSDLDFILRELRNFDHQHWSALLAEMVQAELAEFHPGPNRGVKQGPLAVLTNAIMPSVLVEVGFVTNEEEARLMAQERFQEQAAQAIANAVVRFLERYPPGSGFGSLQ